MAASSDETEHGSTIVIPIRVDTLLVQPHDGPFAEAKMDFSRLPYNDGVEDVNPEFAFISENFLSQPFQNNNLFIAPGLHLHWTLPEALTKGRIDDSDDGRHIKHPSVPNRWAIRRKHKNGSEKIWIVESNYLHPEGQDNKYHSIAYPIPKKGGNHGTGQPFRYIGRSYCIYEKSLDATEKQHLLPLRPTDPEYLKGLTAVGYGEHTFAAFYPNCHSIFGFHDSDITEKTNLTNYRYEVIGWYSDSKEDEMGLEKTWFIDTSKMSSKPQHSSGALHFDGKDDYIHVHAGLPSMTELTIECWVCPESISDWDPILNFDGWDAGFIHFQFTPQGQLGFSLRDNSPTDQICSATFEPNHWYHIAAVYSSRKKHVEFYVNGKKVDTLTYGIAHSSTENMPYKIGAWVEDNRYFNGKLSNLRIWNMARLEEQIRSSLYQTLDGATSNLMASYAFVEGFPHGDNSERLILSDHSGNGHHGELKGFKLSGPSSNWVKGNTLVELSRKLMEAFDYEVIVDEGNLESLQSLSTLCYASIEFNEISESGPREASQIVIGNTGTEALCTWLAQSISSDSNTKKSDLELKLQSFLIGSKIAHKKLNLEALSKETIHEKGFVAHTGGLIWSLRIESVSEQSKPNEGRKKGVEISLPDSFAESINTLNTLQQKYDKAYDELTSLRQVLYSDWCKYMVSAYHSDIEKGLPHMDDIRYYIRNYSIGNIGKKKKEIEALEYKIKHETLEIKKLVALFNYGNRFDTIIFNADGALDEKATSAYPSKKILSEKIFSIESSTDAHLSSATNDTTDHQLEGITTKSYDGTGAGEVLIHDGSAESFNALSFWVSVSANQPVNDKGESYARQLVRITNEQINQGETIIDSNCVGSFWQSVIINGSSIDPYRIIEWHDFPKDQWIHVYLKGVKKLEGISTVTLLDGLKGALAGARLFKAGLTSLELFCDMNMLLLKELKLVNDKAARYWEPTEPVVLISGDLAKPSDRFESGKLLPTVLLDSTPEFSQTAISSFDLTNKGKGNIINKFFDSLKQKQTQYEAFRESSSNTVKTLKPWHPLILEWKVGIAPLFKTDGLVDSQMNDALILKNYGLNSDQPDLTPIGTSEYGALKIFSGSTILTPQAKNRMQHELERYLENLHEDHPDWEHYEGTKPEQLKNPFVNSQGAIDPSKISSPSYEIRADDPISMALSSYSKLDKNHFLSQSLGGFNAGMQMLHQTYQLPIADPIGFEDDQKFAEEVLNNVQRESKMAPLPMFAFDPVRTGLLGVFEVSIIDTFGQIQKVYDKSRPNRVEVHFSEALKEGHLPPRIAQPARINFRWLSAGHDGLEMNEHPISSPVCGWLVPNNLDDSLMVYDQNGNSLGSIHESVPKWRSAPGSSFPIEKNQLPNKHLKKVVEQLLEIPILSDFMELLESTQDQIDPENFALHTDLALLMGRPIAIVRASVGLEVKGKFAINQDWDSFIADMISVLDPSLPDETTRETNGWEHIKFPVRIGEHGQLNDGVLGYWLDSAPEAFLSTVPVKESTLPFGSTSNSKGYNPNEPNLALSLTDTPKTMTLLMDPRGNAHGSCGILPAKLITIPENQYKPALRKMSISFFTRPLLMPNNKVAIPLLNEPDYDWSWLVRTKDKWIELSTSGIVHMETFENTFKNGAEIWHALIKKGWILETENNKAKVVPQNQRKDSTPDEIIMAQHDKIQALLDAGLIIEPEYTANFTNTNVVKEGWLKLTPKTSS